MGANTMADRRACEHTNAKRQEYQSAATRRVPMGKEKEADRA